MKDNSCTAQTSGCLPYPSFKALNQLFKLNSDKSTTYYTSSCFLFKVHSPFFQNTCYPILGNSFLPKNCQTLQRQKAYSILQTNRLILTQAYIWWSELPSAKVYAALHLLAFKGPQASFVVFCYKLTQLPFLETPATYWFTSKVCTHYP